MADEKDLFAPPTQEELDLFAPPSEEELELFAAPSDEELQDTASGDILEELGAAGKAAGTGAAIYAGQKAIEPLAKKVGQDIGKMSESVVGSLGQLTPEQMKVISADPGAYKQAGDIENLLGEFEQLGQDIRETGFSSADEAKKLIRERDISIPKEQIEKRLAESAKSVGFTSDIKPTDELIMGAGAKAPNDLPGNLARHTEPISLDAPVKRGLKQTAELVEKLPQDIKQQNLVNFIDTLKEKASYNKDIPAPVQKIHRDTRSTVRGMIDLQDKEIGDLLGKSHQAIKDEETFKNIAKLKLNADRDFEATAGTKRKLQNMFGKKVDDFYKERRSLEDIIDRYGQKDLLNNMERAQLKQFVKDNTNLSLKGLFASQSENKFVKLMGAMILARDTAGTKMQESLARLSGNPAVKALKKGGKTAGKALWKSIPILGAGLTYSEARAAGADPQMALALTAADEATDIIAPVKMALGSEGLEGDELTRKFEGGEISAQDFAKQFKKNEGVFKNPDALEGLKTTLSTKDGTDKYVDLLDQYQNTESTEEKNQIEFNLQQQPAFRELLKQYDNFREKKS